MGVYNIMVEFPAIYAFCEVAECLSFTEAAERLYTTQSSLSKTIARLEDTVGYKLFNRTSRTVELTPGGKYLYEYFSSTTEEMHQAIEKARLYNEGFAGKLSIAACANTFQIPAPLQLICKFRADNPNVEMEFFSPNMQEARNNIIMGKYDILITRKGEIEPLASCDSVDIITCQPVAYISERHPILKENPSPSLSDLKEYGFVTISSSISPRINNNLFQYCREAGFIPQKVKYVYRLAEMHAEVAVNYRVGILDEYDVVGHYGFHIIPIDNVEKIKIVMAWNVTNTNPQISHLVEYVIAHKNEI